MINSEISKKEIRARIKAIGLNVGDLSEKIGRRRDFLGMKKKVPLYFVRIVELLEEQKKLQDDLKNFKKL